MRYFFGANGGGGPFVKSARPAAAVNARKKRLLSQSAMDYLRMLKDPRVKIRFDIVEVLLADGAVREVRHLANSFSLSPPFRLG